MSQLETGIVNSCMEWLQWRKIPSVRVYAGGLNREGRYIRQRHVEPGTSDILACVKGRFVAVEVKTEPGKVSEVQLRWMQSIIDHGGEAAVVRSVYDLEKFISEVEKKPR
jgi:hypothetical protein